MTPNNNVDLVAHPIFGNKPAPAKSNNNKPVNKSNDERGKLILIGIGLGTLVIAGFMVGLWANSGAGGPGAAIVAWPGQVWQTLMQSQIGATSGAGMAVQTPWVMARVGGIMAYLMAFASVTLGLLMSLKWRWVRQVLQPPTTFYLHKILALLSLTFLVIHLSGLALDNYVKISLWQTLVPFSTAAYRPLWTGLGTLVLYASVLVIITAYLAKKLGYKTWRTVHYLTFGIFALSLLHGIMAGSDTSSLWMQLIYAASGLLVAGLIVARFLPKAATQTARV